jgi:hypothetical protein
MRLLDPDNLLVTFNQLRQLAGDPCRVEGDALTCSAT